MTRVTLDGYLKLMRDIECLYNIKHALLSPISWFSHVVVYPLCIIWVLRCFAMTSETHTWNPPVIRLKNLSYTFLSRNMFFMIFLSIMHIVVSHYFFRKYEDFSTCYLTFGIQYITLLLIRNNLNSNCNI